MFLVNESFKSLNLYVTTFKNTISNDQIDSERNQSIVNLKNITQSFAFSTDSSILVCTGVIFWLVNDTMLYIFASSAYIRAASTSGISVMYTRNSTGPRTLPWGISLLPLVHSDDVPLTTILRTLSERNSSTHL